MMNPVNSFRLFNNFSKEEISDVVGISVKTYEDIEKGLISVDSGLASKFSDFYNAPPDVFITTSQVNYSNNIFESSNAYVHNLFQHDFKLVEILLQTKENEIKYLKEEIGRLRKENSILLNRLLEIRVDLQSIS